MPSARSSGLASLVLRLSLGITFLWAGMGKLFSEFPVSGEDAAYLDSQGALEKAPARQGDPKVSEPKAEPKEQSRSSPVPSLTLVSFQPTAADYPDPIPTRKVNALALMLRRVSTPPENAAKSFPLWHPSLAQGRWPLVFAWTVAITELAGGGLLLLGLVTRLAAAGITGTMLGAIWLTEIGPAIQSGSTYLGFIPVHGAYSVALAPDGYVSLLWQCSLLASAFAVMLLGPGTLALDSAMFGKAPAPRPAPPKPAA